MTVNGPMTRSDRLATLEEVRRSFRRELGRLEGVVIFRLMLVTVRCGLTLAKYGCANSQNGETHVGLGFR
jgi:hypothetical protein